MIGAELFYDWDSNTNQKPHSFQQRGNPPVLSCHIHTLTHLLFIQMQHIHVHNASLLYYQIEPSDINAWQNVEKHYIIKICLVLYTQYVTMLTTMLCSFYRLIARELSRGLVI